MNEPNGSKVLAAMSVPRAASHREIREMGVDLAELYRTARAFELRWNVRVEMQFHQADAPEDGTLP